MPDNGSSQNCDRTSAETSDHARIRCGRPREGRRSPRGYDYPALRSVACAWQAVGITRAAQFFAIDCKPTLEGNAKLPVGSSREGTTGTAYVCQDSAPFSAFVCKDGAIEGSIQFKAPGALCKHPSNTDFGASVRAGELQCE